VALVFVFFGFIVTCSVFLLCFDAFERKRLSVVRKGGIYFVFREFLRILLAVDGAVL
jgi:hypothetical protein